MQFNVLTVQLAIQFGINCSAVDQSDASIYGSNIIKTVIVYFVARALVSLKSWHFKRRSSGEERTSFNFRSVLKQRFFFGA